MLVSFVLLFLLTIEGRVKKIVRNSSLALTLSFIIISIWFLKPDIHVSLFVFVPLCPISRSSFYCFTFIAKIHYGFLKPSWLNWLNMYSVSLMSNTGGHWVSGRESRCLCLLCYYFSWLLRQGLKKCQKAILMLSHFHLI